MAAKSCEGAVDLLGKHGARHFMWERHGGHGYQLVRARSPSGGQPVVPSNEEDKVAAFHF
jgi:hypothetical protein